MIAKQLLTVLLLLGVSSLSNAQNIIKNPGFENHLTNIQHTGTPFTFTWIVDSWEAGCNYSTVNPPNSSPDIFRILNPNDLNLWGCGYNIPDNSRALNRTTRLTNTSAYAGGTQGESMIGCFDQALEACEYDLSFYVSPSEQTGCTNFQPSINTFNTEIEFVLKNSADVCGGPEVVVWTSNVLTFTPGPQGWVEISGSFILTPGQASSFDRFEVRQKDQQGGWLYYDDFFLEKSNTSTTADISPVNEIGYNQINNLDVPQFCAGDPIIFDGSESLGENAYFIHVEEFDINTGMPITTIVDGWTSGQAPNSIDITNILGTTVNYTAGSIYLLTFAVGPCWDVQYVYFEVVECCPDKLEYELDCSSNTISIVNLPSTATNIDVDWFRVLQVGNGNNSVTIPMSAQTGLTMNAIFGYGVYICTVTFDLSNGLSCQLTRKIRFNEDECCKLYGPQVGDLAIQHNGFFMFNHPQFGPIKIYEADCDSLQIYARSDCANEFVIGIEPFDLAAWQVESGYSLWYTVNPNPYGSVDILGNVNFPFQDNQEYLISICATNGVQTNCHYEVIHVDCPSNLPVVNPSSQQPSQKEFIATVYPNPTIDKITINLSDRISGQMVLRSPLGEIIYDTSFDETSKIYLDLSNYPAGVYSLEIVTENAVITKRIVRLN